MKTIGLIGGMSWESTIPYYRTINRMVATELGGFHSARLVLHSVDFQEIEACQMSDRWDDAGRILASAAAGLHQAGAELMVLCTNSMHKVADAIEAAAPVPFLHIADATATRIRAAGMRRIGLLGTRFTMEEAFYVGRLTERHALEVCVPDAGHRAEVHRIIYEELCRGTITESSRQLYQDAVRALAADGAEGVILGCTEIGLLLRAEDVDVPLFDTAIIHAETAARVALGLDEAQEPHRPAR
jgi:aspartate racemase